VSDPDELRAAVRDRWERAADGWRNRNAAFQAATIGVSQWLVEAIAPQPGQRVLELAAGLGETGFLAAELLEPGGTLISSDGAEPMLEHARERAAQLGIRNVEFLQLELEWIDLPTASVDAVICRWGYMFALDPEAALREARRVVRPGGRIALATWTGPERNPMPAIPRRALYDAGLVASEQGEGPGMFDLADPERLATLLADAGFDEIEVDELPLTFTLADADELWDTTIDLSRPTADLVATLNERQIADLRERVARGARPYEQPDGTLRFPGVALGAAATA
jgi:SAM-dependent methyltransferase